MEDYYSIFILTFCSVFSSDDYYEYGHSGESYDSYGEFHLIVSDS